MKNIIRKFLLWYFDIKEVPKIETEEAVQEVVIIDNIETVNSGRRSGRTTRHADAIIQKFFNSETNEKIRYFDHYFIGTLNNCHLRKTIVRRLEVEHGLKINKDFKSGFDRNSNILIKRF